MTATALAPAARPPSDASAPPRARPLRIALGCGSDGMGGAETMIVHLAEALVARGHHVEFLGPAAGSGWLGPQLAARGVPVHALSLGRVRARPVLEIRRILRAIRADVLHSHLLGLAMFGTAATAGLAVPHVVTMHGTGNETSAARRRWVLRGVLRACDAAVAVSDGLRVELRGLVGPVADRMVVLPNGVPERRGDREATRRALGIGDGERLVLAVGNLYAVKGHAVLLDALARMPADVPWRLAIAGRWEEDAGPQLERTIIERGWAGRATLLGPRADVPDLLAAADVYAMPSLNEALPMALLEAMTAGKAIVATTVGGIPEAVRDGVDGLLVPPAEAGALGAALARLLADPTAREAMGRSARARALALYSVSHMTDAHEGLYHAVARPRAEAAPAAAPAICTR